MIFYITAVANGFLNTVNKMVNVKAGECLGTANAPSSIIVEATIISLCLIFGNRQWGGNEFFSYHRSAAAVLSGQCLWFDCHDLPDFGH